MASPHRKTIMVVVKLFLTGVVLYILFHKIPFARVLAVFRESRWDYVAAGLGLGVIIRLLEALQMQVMARKQQVNLRLWEILDINLTATFYALFLPGMVAGSAFKLYRFARAGREPTGVLLALALQRYLRLFGALLFGVLFWFLDEQFVRYPALGVMLIGVSLIFALAYGIISHNRLRPFWRRVVLWAEQRLVPAKFSGQLWKFGQAVLRLRAFDRRDTWFLVWTSTLINVFAVFSYYCMCRALSIEISVVNVGWIRTVVYLVTTIPFTFAGLGLREGGLLLIMEPYGIPPATILALSFLFYLIIVLFALLGGVLEAMTIWRPRRAGGSNEQG